MIEICALASGSNGNCYYIGNEEEAILIDAGLSFKQILNRMAERALNPKRIKALFITHEHGDHIRGARVMGKRLDIPVFMTEGTFRASFSTWKPISYIAIQSNVPVRVGAFTIFPVGKNHDAAEPTSFRVAHEETSVGVFTDIGSPCENVIHHLNQCHALFLETNYDQQMLKEGPYPIYLKARIESAVGHLSNIQAYQLLKEHAHASLQCVFLSHLSKENNRPELALNEFKQLEGRFLIKVTDRYAASELYTLQNV